MGFAKNVMMEEQARGWASPGDLHVCSACLGDSALAEYARANASERTCDFCHKRSRSRRIAAPLGGLLELIAEGLRAEWADPDSVGIPWDSREGGYQAKCYHTYELLADEFNGVITNARLLQTVANAFESQGTYWCSKDALSLDQPALFSYSWESFSRHVKHARRYTLELAETEPDIEEDDDIYPPQALLSRLAHDASRCELPRTLPPGSIFYRARTHKRTTRLWAATDLGPPTIDKAKYSNRMSPAGIPMFYGSGDAGTAICETVVAPRDRGKVVTVGRFSTGRSMLVLDLTHLPDVPSLFDRERRHLRQSLMFLRGFVSEISRPVPKDGREHVEYVPSQVVTEYFRHSYRTPSGEAIHGILYRSSVTSAGINCVLFLNNESCVDIHRGWKQKRSSGDPSKWAWWLGLDRTGTKTTRIPPSRDCRND